jgi:hypothetical protein
MKRRVRVCFDKILASLQCRDPMKQSYFVMIGRISSEGVKVRREIGVHEHHVVAGRRFDPRWTLWPLPIWFHKERASLASASLSSQDHRVLIRLIRAIAHNQKLVIDPEAIVIREWPWLLNWQSVLRFGF